MSIITFCKFRDDAVLPDYATQGAIGMDITTPRFMADVTIPSMHRALIKTGIGLILPEDTYGRVAPRSGLALKSGIDVLAGVIDPDYRGELGVILINFGITPFVVRANERIAQLIVESAVKVAIDAIDKESFEGYCTSERGSGGFGSTG